MFEKRYNVEYKTALDREEDWYTLVLDSNKDEVLSLVKAFKKQHPEAKFKVKEIKEVTIGIFTNEGHILDALKEK